MAKKKIKETKKREIFAFDKSNYLFMIGGFVIIVIGLILMAGGGSEDPNTFSRDIFSTRRITVAPILILIGFVLELYAVLKKPGKSDEKQS